MTKGQTISNSSTRSDENGEYLFSGLPVLQGVGSDDYLIWLNGTAGILMNMRPTYDFDGAAPTNGLATAYRMSAALDLDANGTLLHDFGYAPMAHRTGDGLIGDTIFLDLDHDGLPGAGEGAADPERNRAYVDNQGAEPIIVTFYEVYQGHGVEDSGEPVNAGFRGGGPLSAGIDLRAFQSADGIYVEFIAYEIEQAGTITLMLYDPGESWLWLADVEVEAGDYQTIRFKVPELELGGVYTLGVMDEASQFHEADGVEVKPFAAEMIRLARGGVTLGFASIPGRQYKVQWTEHLGSAWQDVGRPFTAVHEHTELDVPDPGGPRSATGFFRIILQ